MSTSEFFTSSGVRLRKHFAHAGSPNWLFLPGGPGIGSESLVSLMEVLDVPGTLWGVDLPGDGSNVDAPGAPEDSFSVWPYALVEAAQALPNVVFVGHSTGGMYLLSCPELESILTAMVLVSTAPNASWHPRFVEMVQQHPLPEVDRTSAIYDKERTPERLRDVAVASAEWNFGPHRLEAGRELLRSMPYRPEAVDWSDANFDHTYVAQWWPASLPTLIVSGTDDRIVDQSLWDRREYEGANVLRRKIGGGAHFPWIEEPEAVNAAFRDLVHRVEGGK